MQATPMDILSGELVRDLTAILKEPSYIYIDSIEPDRDRLPVPRFVLAAVIEAFDLSNRQHEIYRGLVRDLAQILREILKHEPALVGTPTLTWAQDVLDKLEAANAR